MAWRERQITNDKHTFAS